jgi:hypothetical protein
MHKPPPWSGGLADAIQSEWCFGYQPSDTKNPTDQSSAEPLTATLIVQSVGRYTVKLDGEIIVANSRDPEFDACRVLLGRGLRGRLTFVDQVSGKPHLSVDTERGAGLVTKEGPLHFAKWRLSDRSPTAEDDEAGA